MKINQRRENKKTRNKKKKNLKEKGITLVALVVTIIIMLILAGVTLNLTLGENGLIKYAKRTRELYENSSLEEQETINKFANDLMLSQYIKNGLIVQYDAINNSGNGHKDNSALKNLAGNSEYDGKINGATINSNYISFDGENDYIEIGQVDCSTVTIEMTVKGYDQYNNGERRLISNSENGGIACLLTTNNNLRWYIGGGTTPSANAYTTLDTPMTFDKIINIVLVFDGKKADIYINNNLKVSGNLNDKTYIPPKNDNGLFLGAECDRRSNQIR